MILIDEHADRELATLLEAFKLDPDYATRCIHFHFKSTPTSPRLKEVIIDSAQRHLLAAEPKIFFCDTTDIVILSQQLPSKDGNKLILDVVDHLHIPADQSWVTFDDLARQSSTLLIAMEAKLETKRLAEEAFRKLQQQQQHERKRQSILNKGGENKSGEIQHRRNTRPMPELMMIEDDAFSRRLVENVLQKKYALTSLSDASHAIETYARIAPDLLFLDINLPDVTGHELLERFLAIDPEAHVIMLSGNADQANIVEAMRKGAKGFIAKPFTREKLFQYIDRCAGIAHKQHSAPVS